MRKEDIFVRKILKGYLKGKQVQDYTIEKNFDFNTITEKIFAHGLEGIAYYELTKRGINDLFPQDFMEKLKWGSRNTAIVNMLLYNEFIKIIKELIDKGISVIPVKGILSVKELYENMSLRPMADIDLFVKEEEYTKAIAVLKDKGYRESDFLPLRRWERENFRIALTKRGQIPVTIELHKRFAQPGRFELSYKDALENVTSMNLEGLELRTFNREFTFLFLIHHLGMHYFNVKLIWVADIVRFLYKEKLDWDKIIEYVKKYKMNTVLYLTMRLLEEYIEKDRLPAIYYRPSWLKRVYFNLIFSHKSLNFFRFPSMNIRLAQLIAELPLIDLWRDRIRFLKNYIKIRVYDYFQISAGNSHGSGVEITGQTK